MTCFLSFALSYLELVYCLLFFLYHHLDIFPFLSCFCLSFAHRICNRLRVRLTSCGGKNRQNQWFCVFFAISLLHFAQQKMRYLCKISHLVPAQIYEKYPKLLPGRKASTGYGGTRLPVPPDRLHCSSGASGQ